MLLAVVLLLPFPAPALELRDDTGHSLHLAQPATRIVPLYGAITELICAMGLEDRLIGRTDADARVEELHAVQHLPSTGTHLRPNTERIVSLRPDLILQMIGRQDSLEQVERLRRMGLPVAAFHLRTLDDVLRLADWLGEALGAPEKARALRENCVARLDAVQQRIRRDVPPPRVFFEVRYPNLLAAGQDAFVDDVIRLAGGVNVVSVPGRVARLNEEELLRLNPDVYVYQRGPMNPAPSFPGERGHYGVLSAVRQGRVLEVNEQIFSRPGPRAVQAVEQLAAFLWP